MGFEQLAALKEKLAEQAKNESRAKATSLRRAPSAKLATPVDPVVRVIGKLQKRFPLAFPKNPAPKVPLKVGIFNDLLAHVNELALTEAELRNALQIWCRGARYWACLAEGKPRLDLAGQEAGQVTEADARRGQQLRTGRARQNAARPTAPQLD
jgi:ProP effector